MVVSVKLLQPNWCKMCDDTPMLDDEVVDRLVEMMKNEGYFNDESAKLGSHFVEHEKDYILRRMRDRGYTGGDIVGYGKFYKGHGAVYWVFDPDVMDYDQSLRRTDQWVKTGS